MTSGGLPSPPAGRPRRRLLQPSAPPARDVRCLTFIFLYCNVSTLNPMVGIVWTASSDSFWRRYRMVVFPALSRPRMSILTSFDPKRPSNRRDIKIPMVAGEFEVVGTKHKSQRANPMKTTTERECGGMRSSVRALDGTETSCVLLIPRGTYMMHQKHLHFAFHFIEAIDRRSNASNTPSSCSYPS